MPPVLRDPPCAPSVSRRQDQDQGQDRNQDQDQDGEGLQAGEGLDAWAAHWRWVSFSFFVFLRHKSTQPTKRSVPNAPNPLSDWPRIFGIHTQLFSVDIIRLPEFPLLGRRNWTCEKSRLFSFCPPTSRFLTWPKTKGILRKNWRSPTWIHKIQIE